MTGEQRRAEARAFYEAAGGESLDGHSATGAVVHLGALPVPDGTVQVTLLLHVTPAGPVGLQVIVPVELARLMGELLTRVAGR